MNYIIGYSEANLLRGIEDIITLLLEKIKLYGIYTDTALLMADLTERGPSTQPGILGEQFMAAMDMYVATYGVVQPAYGEEAHGTWQRLRYLRTQRLEDVLRKRGEVVCSRPQHHWANELGIAKEAESALVFSSDKDGVRLEILCPTDTPNPINHVEIDMATDWDNKKRRPDLKITSAITKRDGRLFTVIDDIDVTGIPIRGVSDYWDEVYAHFGFPSLPPQPDFPTPF